MSLKIFIGTHNLAKFDELNQIIKSYYKDKFKILSPSDLNIKNSPEETGQTISQNAEIKATYYGNLTHLPTISDDGSFTIPILNNEPGVKSRRWLGHSASDKELIAYTLKRMSNISQPKRTAYLETSLCFYNPQTKKKFFSHQKIKGRVAEKPSKKTIKGYPYKSLFIVDQYNKYYDQLTNKEHNLINHRIKALKKLFPKITKSLLK